MFNNIRAAKGIIKYDLKQGFRVNIWKYALGMLPFFSAILILENGSRTFSQKLSFFDHLIYLFKGIKIYTPIQGKQFEVPVLWMCLQIFVALIVFNYPKDNYEKYGEQTIMRAGTKGNWWFSKWIWEILSILLYYFMGILIIFVFCLVNQNITGNVNADWNKMINGIDLTMITQGQLWILCILIPVLTSVTLSTIQFTLSFIINPIYSFVFVMSYLVISVYYNNPWAIGANSMVLRNGYIIPGGITISQILSVDFLIIITAVLTGYLYFSRTDILQKKV